MHTSHYPSLVHNLSNAIYFNVTKRERHSSGTAITINHNLLPIYMSLSTPCFNLFINDKKVFCTPGIVASFLHLQKSSHCFFSSSQNKYFHFASLYIPVPFQSQHQSTVLLPCQCPCVLPGLTVSVQTYFHSLLQISRPLQSTPSSDQHPQRVSCGCQVKQDRSSERAIIVMSFMNKPSQTTILQQLNS